MNQHDAKRRWKCPYCAASCTKYVAWLGHTCPLCQHQVLIEWEPYFANGTKSQGPGAAGAQMQACDRDVGIRHTSPSR